MRADQQIILTVTHNAYVMEISVTEMLPKRYKNVTERFNILVYIVSWFLLKNEATITEGRKSR
jgi:hypothetical protein